MIQNQLLLSRARSAALSRDFDLAARLYRQILRDDRNNVDVLKQLGNIYMKNQRDDLALPVFKQIVELAKGDFEAQITLGGIYRRLKMYEDSIAVLEQALVFDSANPQVSYNLGFTYKIMGDLENAIGCFEDTIEMNPEDVLAYNHIGTIYAEKNEHEKAVQSYLRGLNVDSNHPVLLLNIAKSYEALGDYKNACDSYSRALRSKPLWNDAVNGYSRVLVRTNRAQEAHSLVRRALAANPADEGLKENLKYIEQFVEIQPAVQKQETAAKPAENSPEELGVDLENASEIEPETQEVTPEQNSGEAEIQENIEEPAESEEDAVVEETLELPEGEEPEDAEAEAEIEDAEEDFGLDGLTQEDGQDFDFDSFGQENFEIEEENPEFEGEIEEETEGEADDGTEDQPEESARMPLDEAADQNPVCVWEENFSQTEDEGLSEEENFDGTEAQPEEESFGGNETLSEYKEDKKEKTEYVQKYPSRPLFTARIILTEEKRQPEEAQTKTVPEAQPLAQPDAQNEELSELPADEEEVFEPAMSAMPEDEAPDAVLPSDVGELEDILQSDETEPELVEELPQNPELALFVKLKELLEFLPEEEKCRFKSSETRLLLDYVIARLSGGKGLLKKAGEVIEAGASAFNSPAVSESPAADETFPAAPEASAADTAESTSTAVLTAGLKVVRKLTDELSDKNLVYAMENLLKKLPVQF